MPYSQSNVVAIEIHRMTHRDSQLENITVVSGDGMKLLTNAQNDGDLGTHSDKLRRSRVGDRSNPTVSEFFAAQAISSRNLKRELRAHLSLRMHWKIIYGTELKQGRA